MIPLFPQLHAHPVWRIAAAVAWLFLPIFGTLAIYLHARKSPHDPARGTLAALFALCQVTPWLLILANVPLGLTLWAFCLCFRYRAHARCPAVPR